MELIYELGKYDPNLPVEVMVIEEVYYANKEINKVISRDKGDVLPGCLDNFKVEESTVFLIVNDPENEAVIE